MSQQPRYFTKEESLYLIPTNPYQHVGHGILFGVLEEGQGFQNVDLVVAVITSRCHARLSGFVMAASLNEGWLVLAGLVERRNLAGRNPVHQRPEVSRLPRETAFGAKYLPDLALRKRLPEPAYCRFTAILQDPEDRIVGISLGVKAVKVRVPK